MEHKHESDNDGAMKSKASSTRLLPPEPCRLRQGKVWSLGEAGMHYSYVA